jgi:hypothetical protein
VFIGSQSLRELELDARREIGMIFRNQEIADKITEAFEEDWKAAEVENGAADDAEKPRSAKIAKKVAKSVSETLPPVAPVVEKIAKEVLQDEVPIDHEEIEETVKMAVKQAVKQAVREAVEDFVQVEPEP